MNAATNTVKRAGYGTGTGEAPPPQPTRHHQVVIVGGGTAGLTVAARLRRRHRHIDVAIIEPATQHYYQPLWTLVGGGAARIGDTARDEAELIPDGAAWFREKVVAFRPDENAVITDAGTVIGYDYLVVAPGLQIDWERIAGLPEALGKGGVVSNYAYDQAPRTWDAIRTFRGGNAIFTQPNTPVKCGGAPQKIMYLAEEQFVRAGVRDRATVIFASAAATIFGVPEYARALERVGARKHIETRFRHDLVAIHAAAQEAVFQHLDSGDEVVLPYGLLHVTPPMSAPDFVKRSPLAHQDGPNAGWVKADKYTLRHPDFPNVFSLGDVAALPTSKTGAAIRKQAPVVVRQLAALIAGRDPAGAVYDGYSSCPLVTGYGKLILAEFKYDNVLAPSFPIDSTRERPSMYLLKKYGLPRLYWQGMLRGLV